MGWLEAKRRYTSGETLADQKVEDMVARRVLRGMGFVAKQIADLERALGITVDYDAALWPRTLEVFRQVAMRSRPGYFGLDRENPGFYAIDVRETDAKHKPILEMLPMLEAHKNSPHPLFLTRVKNTQVSLAYFIIRGECQTDEYDFGRLDKTAWWLKPPVHFIAEAGPWWIGVQETEHFIRQFGPYQSPLQQE